VSGLLIDDSAGVLLHLPINIYPNMKKEQSRLIFATTPIEAVQRLFIKGDWAPKIYTHKKDWGK